MTEINLMETSWIMSLTASLFAAGIGIYFLLLLLAFAFKLSVLDEFKAGIKRNIPFNVGLPVSGIGSFGVVSVFWSAFPHGASESGDMQLQFMNLQFSGPSGPITLWVLCFLAMVLGMYLFKDNVDK